MSRTPLAQLGNDRCAGLLAGGDLDDAPQNGPSDGDATNARMDKNGPCLDTAPCWM